MASASCPVRDLSSPRVVPFASWQSASWRIRELSIHELALTSCLLTGTHASQYGLKRQLLVLLLIIPSLFQTHLRYSSTVCDVMLPALSSGWTRAATRQCGLKRPAPKTAYNSLSRSFVAVLPRVYRLPGLTLTSCCHSYTYYVALLTEYHASQYTLQLQLPRFYPSGGIRCRPVSVCLSVRHKSLFY